jgi:hypothetical protein
MFFYLDFETFFCSIQNIAKTLNSSSASDVLTASLTFAASFSPMSASAPSSISIRGPMPLQLQQFFLFDHWKVFPSITNCWCCARACLRRASLLFPVTKRASLREINKKWTLIAQQSYLFGVVFNIICQCCCSQRRAPPAGNAFT